MGIGYAFSQLFKGNVENAFNGLFSDDSLLAAQDAAGDNLSKIIARQQAEGLIDDTEAMQLYSQMSPNTNSEAYWESSGSTPWNEFTEGIEDSASKIGQFGSSAINKTLGIGFRLIPWQVYVIGFVVLLIWLYPIWQPFAASIMRKK